jgi:hypothetical protein
MKSTCRKKREYNNKVSHASSQPRTMRAWYWLLQVALQRGQVEHNTGRHCWISDDGRRAGDSGRRQESMTRIARGQANAVSNIPRISATTNANATDRHASKTSQTTGLIRNYLSGGPDKGAGLAAPPSQCAPESLIRA